MRVLVCSLLVAACVCAQTPTFDDSLNFRSVSGAQISPDGKQVVYQVNKTNWDENAFETELWLVSAATGERYQLTAGKKSSGSPKWSPDGKRIAFLSDRDGKKQIYVIAPRGGEAVQFTKVESAVSAFEWSPDGKWLAYTSAGPETEAMKKRKERYGEFDIVQSDYNYSHLWRINVDEPGKPEALTSGEQFTVMSFRWSPESLQIAFAAAKNPDLSVRDTSDIYVVRVSDKGLRKLVDTKGPDSNPVWSPDGKQIAYETSDGQEFHYYANSRIAIVPVDGGKPAVLKFELDEDASLQEWKAEGLYLAAMDKTRAHLYRIDPANGKVERVSAPAENAYSSFSFDKEGAQTAFQCAEPNGFSNICVSPVRGFAARKLTDVAEQWKQFQLAKREVVQWKSTDGATIEGVLIKPADYQAGRKYPLLVIIHGGPTGVDRPTLNADRYYPTEKFAAKGALILRPNYRGSAGYGEKFRSLNVRNLGVGDYWDVISGVDALVEKGLVDPQRVGAMGWSQGGYISAFITCSSDRFKAVSVGAGISDWMTYYVNTDIHPFTRQYLKATPWDDPEIYRKTSPITYVKAAKTPTLIQHGELDKRVPIPNAYELRQALEDRGVPVRMVVYKGFGHGIDKPKQQRHLMEENYAWFSKYIWGEEVPQAAPATDGR